MGIPITTQNLTASYVPVATQFFGVPFALLGGANYFEDDKGNSLEVLSEDAPAKQWGRGWALCAMHKRGIDALSTATTEFFPAARSRDEAPLEELPLRATFKVTVEGVEHLAHMKRFPQLHGAESKTNAALTTYYGRIGNSQHVVWLHVYETQRAIMRFEGFIGTSDPRVPDTVSIVDSIEMLTKDRVMAVLDFSAQRGIKFGDKISSVKLTGSDRFMHGQGFPFTGRLLFLDRMKASEKERDAAVAQVHAPVVSQVASYALEGHVGPFLGVLPQVHPKQAGRELELALADYKGKTEGLKNAKPGDHWAFDGKYTGVTTPSRTGGNETFGMIKLAQSLAVPAGFPAVLQSVLPDIYSEAKRPSHFFEADGIPFQAALHPEFRALGQGPHYDPSICKDLLGKPERYMWTTKPSGGWYEEDWAHSGSSIVIGLHALIAGSALSRQLCTSDTELYKTLDPGQKHFYQARGQGRSLLDLYYAEAAVDDSKLREHVAKLLEQDPGLKEVRRQADAQYDIVVYEHDPDGDGRKLDGILPYWMPWSSPGLHLPGLYAAAMMTGKKDLAKREAIAMATTLALYGIWKPAGQNRWEIGNAIVYRGGEALTPAEYADPKKVQTSGGMFHDWVYPALALYAPLLKGKAQEKAIAFCTELREQWEVGGAPRKPFGRPVEFFAVPDARRDSSLF